MTDKPKTREMAIPLGVTENGGQKMLLLRGEQGGPPKEAKLGIVYPIEHGVPLPPGADLIQMKPSENGPHLECETLYESPIMPKSGSGWKPASVTFEKFTSNWASTFGRKGDPDPTLN